MLNINKTNRLKIIAAILIVLAALAGAYIYYQAPLGTKRPEDTAKIKDRPVGEIDYSSPTKSDEKPITEVQDPATITKPTTGPDIPVSISYMGGSPLQIRVVIPELLTSGECKLHIVSSSGKVYDEKSDLFPTSNTTTCKGFNVATTEIGQGSYTTSVTVTSGERTGTVSKDGTL